MDGEAMTNSIQTGDQPLHVIAYVSLAGTAQKQNQGDVNDDLGYKKKVVVVTSDPLALVAEKTKITALLAKAFDRKKYYAEPINNNLRTSSASFSANKKPEYVNLVEKKEDKKADEKKRDMSKVKCYNCKKEGHFSKDCKKAKVKVYNYKTKMLLAKKDSDEQVLLAEDQAWMESSSDSDQEINANMKRIEKANQQSKDLENQNKDLQEKYDVLINQVNTFEGQNNEFNEQIKVLNKKNADLLPQIEVLQDQLKVKHVVIDTHTECQAQYAKLREERYKYMIRYSALCDNDKQHRKKIDKQEILFDNVRRPKKSNVIWKKKGSSNTFNVDLSSVSHLKLNKDVKRYSRKDLLSCNNSHFGEKSSAYVCNDAMNVSCNSRLCDSFDENNLFIFDDESVRISPVSKMPFRKKPCDSMNVRSKSNWNKSLPRTVHRWLPKMKPLAEPIAKFLGTVRFGNNDFAVIAGYGDVVIGSMIFKNKTLAKFFDEVGITQQYSATRTPQQNGVVERRNRTLVEAARTMLTFANLPLFLWAEAIAIACFTQNHSIIHKHFDKTPYELMNKRKPNIKFFCVFGCRCYLLNDYEDVGKLKAKGDIRVFVGYSKESDAFRIYNKRTRKIHESMNVHFDEISEMASKQFSLEPNLSNLNETGKSSNPSVSQVSKTSKKDLEDLFQNFYDEYFDSSKIMKSSTTNVETSNVEIPSNEEEVFHESFESFQEEYSSSSLNDDV
nr:retrovirus-related Pol polyprotein from transposon TNT 1-94 [Tanacetum cinerariifolium]